MNIFIRILILAIALFFAIGAVFAWRGDLETSTYIVITGVVGSIASVLGLIALSMPRLTPNDIRNVEAELFNTLADQVRSAKEYDEKLAANRQELSRLERERAEVELLVRQASLKLFMEERLRYISSEIDKRISTDPTLLDLLSNYETAVQRVEELDGQIERSARADLIGKILSDVHQAATEQGRRLLVHIPGGGEVDIYPFILSLQKIGRWYIQAMRRF